MAFLESSFKNPLHASRLAIALGLVGTVVLVGSCRKDTSLLNQGSDAAGSTGHSDEGGAGSGSGGSDSGGESGGKGGSKADGGTSGGATGNSGGTTGLETGTGGTGGASATTLPDPVVEVSEIGYTYAGQPTDMTLYTVGTTQFVGYWNGARTMSVARRTIGKPWSIASLVPVTTIENDAHHSVVLATDTDGYLHVSGKMHSSPLIYYRSTTPLVDVDSNPLSGTGFEPSAYMALGQDMSACTYPQFFKKGDGTLVYSFRSGVSGQGDTFFNAFSTTEGKWSSLLGKKLIDGGGADSAYIVGPVKGPDGYWHLVWTWRATGAAETNHDLSYARTKDFVTWESGTGAALTVPITLSSAVIVDPVPQNGGIINNNTQIGFDAAGSPVIAYHKKDETPDRFTQLYNARVENGAWVTHKTSDWNSTWAFSGAGTIEFQIVVEGLKTTSTGTLKQAFYHKTIKNGWGGFSLDPVTLKGTDLAVAPLPYPVALNTVDSTNTTAGMRVRWAADSGTSPDPDVYYMMRWETLEANGDAPRAEPPATKLRVYAIRKSTMELWQ